MFKDILTNICQNKNLLMLMVVGVYILALYTTLCGCAFVVALGLTLGLIFLVAKDYLPSKYALVWIFIFYFGVFNTSARLKTTDELLNIAPMNSTIYGKILSIPQSKGDGKTKFLFDVKQIEYDDVKKNFKDEKAFVTINTVEKLKIYDSYKITGRLATPFKAGNPSQFDYGNYLRNFDAYSVFYAKDGNFSKIEGNTSNKEKLLQKINDYREKILGVHSKYLQSPNIEILGGIVFGDDAVSPPQNIKTSFVNSGLLHILAASGMNVAFIFTFFYLILSFLRVNYKVNISLCILTVITYSFMTGLGASVIRATCMLVFVLVGKLIDRDAHSISLLSFVAFLMLLYNPMYINDVGFQLSFVVTFGLLVMTPYLAKSKSKILNWVIGTISIPVIAQLWVMPIQIFYFNNISLYSVFANIMSVPILAVISFGGFVSSLISMITPIADIVCKCFDFILNPMITVLVNISDFWGKLPHATHSTSHPALYQIFLYYALLLNIIAFFDENIREKYLKALKISLSGVVLVLLLSFINIPNHNLEITAFDVGNADAFLIKSPSNKYYMIDTAKSGYNGGKSQTEIIILKYMQDRGLKNLEGIIITHFDNDHCGGAVDLMNNLNVKRVYVNSLEHDSNAAKDIYKTAKSKDVELIEAKNNQIVTDDFGLKIENFIDNDSLAIGDNEASIITLLTYKNFKMLFTGDAGVSTFNKIKTNLPSDITVLKVGHHGAFGSVDKAMLEYLNPKYSLISVGENKFGHPSIYTIELLKNTLILRTDAKNSIRFIVNDTGYRVYAYNIKKKKYVKI